MSAGKAGWLGAQSPHGTAGVVTSGRGGCAGWTLVSPCAVWSK